MPTQDSVRTFHKGKMNRDNDPRVIQNGEYIRLVNGRIARSEGDGVGSIENTLGNELISTFVDVDAVVLGSVRDIAEDKIYYFIKGSEEDAVYEFDEDTGATNPILRDDKGILNFSVDHLITGINIIGQSEPGDDEEDNPDDINSQKLLLWTDNFNPPRKININRIKADLGGSLGGFTESEISLEKAPPLFSPQTEEVYLNIDTAVAPEAEINVIIPQDDINKPLARKREIAQLTIDSLNKEENLKEKFPRFAYRYRYQDNEYSAFSPFSKPMFRPGTFGYDQATGTITGMENQMRAVDISFNTGPREVTEIDLLYKDTMSNTVYVIESYNKADREWGNNVDLSHLQAIEKPIRFSTQKLYRALPDSQLLRVYDNVPLKAQAMEVVDNRVMFGNYVDQYDLIDVRKEFNSDGDLVNTVEEEIVVDINARISKPEEVGQSGDSIQPGVGERSLKSDRDYELGIVYLDNLGRQTPVLTSQNNSVNIPVDRANKINRLSVEINSKAPEFATHYRMFVKDTRSLPHHNIIPLETQIQPDDNNFRWFRLAETDQEKVKEGDYLVLKVSKGSFVYQDEDTERIQVRVEEIGIRGKNFMEVNPPRIGRVTNDDDTSENEGQVLDPGVEATIQKAGLWMKIKNIGSLPRDEEQPAGYSESYSRSNNARNSNFRPIKGLPDTVEYWKDLTYYYRGNNVTAESILSEDSLTFSGMGSAAAWTPGTDNTPATGLILGPADNTASPMRVEVEILEGNMFRASFWLSPASDDPAVVKQSLDDRAIPTAAPFTEDIINGVTVTFDDTVDYNVGDRWVCTYRNSNNFMWRVWQDSGGAPANRYGSPNNASRYAFNARRSHIMLHGPGLLEQGINGRSMIQFGIEDGLNGALEGDPIALSYRRNQYYTDDVFYPNLEEWMFEEGYWTAGGAKKLAGTARDGENIGIHQFGFYRGVPVTPEAEFSGIERLLTRALTGQSEIGGAVFSSKNLLRLGLQTIFSGGFNIVGTLLASLINGKSTKDFWRLQSDTYDNLIYEDTTEDGELDTVAAPLYAFVQSGTRNEGSNNKKANPRQNATFSFFQGTGVGEDEINMLNIAFETIPEESSQDIYYEIGETFTCLNGVHFGNEMSNSQKITYLDDQGNETFDAFREVTDDNGIVTGSLPNSETRKVSSITVNLEYNNCFAWNNGVEVKSIRDEIGTPALDSGAKANIVVQDYEESSNFGNIIFSERFDQQAGVNGLNEFSSTAAALGRNIKEMDEADGSIQKMYSKDTNIIVFQEDKVSQVLVGKDQLLNADGSSNITSAQQVLGQTIAYQGEFGISTNPESFAVYGNRVYFSDANRGVICRLGQSGIEEISNFGMRDFFRDELGYRYDGRPPVVIGQYDDYHDQYVVSIREPINDPSLPRINKPLLLSKQAFLSRTDACRYPEEDLQFTQVYEFYTANEPQGFQVGDLIYYDEARTKVYNGDNDWFVWYDHVNELDVTGAIASQPTVGEDVWVQTFEGAEFPDQPLIEQRVSVVNLADGGVYQGEVINVVEVEGSFNVSIRYDSGQNIVDGDLLAGDYEINTTYKYVINIDNFGVVRARVNCVGVLPANYDAVRISIRSYTSPQEACGKGVVTRMVFHDGDDVTPDVEDAIYDTPYGSDEFIDGDYSKGRTQKRGWYKMFDGDGFEDYVINIIQGKVEKKIPCAQIEAGRTRVLTSEFPIQRRMNEIERRLATRICAVLPAEESFHDGEGIFPVLGDTLFEDNFTDSPLPMGYYAIDGGFYARVNEEGTITFIDDCSIELCYDDVVRARVMKRQDRDINNWRFCGVGDPGIEYPTVSATTGSLSEQKFFLTLTADATVTATFTTFPLGYDTTEEEGDRLDFFNGLIPGQAFTNGTYTSTRRVDLNNVTIPEGTPFELTSTGIEIQEDINFGTLPLTGEIAEIIYDFGGVIFNGRVDSLGGYPTDETTINTAWYWLNVPDDADGNPMFTPTERDLLNDGRRIAGITGVPGDVNNPGVVMTGSTPDVTRFGFPSFANIYHMFVAEVDNVFITTDVLLAETLRTILPTTTIVASGDADPMTPNIIDVALGEDVTLSSSYNAEPGDIPTGYQWLLNGAAIAGETNANLAITDFEAADAGNYSLQTFFPGGLTIVSNVLNLQYVIVFRTTAFARSAPTTNAPGDMTSDHTLTVTGVPGSTYDITVDHGTISPSSGTIPGTATPTNLSDTFTHTWTLPINTADGTDTSLGNGEQDRTATIAVTGATVEHTGDDDVVVTHDDAPAPVDVDPVFAAATGPHHYSGGTSTGTTYGGCGGYGPALGTRTTDFTQTRTCTGTTTYSDQNFRMSKVCNVNGGNTPLWGGVYNDCSDADGTAAWLGTLHFDFTSSGVSPTTSTSTTCGICTRPITVTGTSAGGTSSTEAVQGDQNSDNDTVDDVFQGDTLYTTSPNIGSHTVTGTGWTVTTNRTPVITLTVNENFTGQVSQVNCSGATSGSTVSGGLAPYSWTRTCTPNTGFEIDSGGDGMPVSETVSGTVAGDTLAQSATINIGGNVTAVAPPIPTGSVTVSCIEGFGFTAACECTPSFSGSATGYWLGGGFSPGDAVFSLTGDIAVTGFCGDTVTTVVNPVCDDGMGNAIICQGSAATATANYTCTPAGSLPGMIGDVTCSP